MFMVSTNLITDQDLRRKTMNKDASEELSLIISQGRKDNETTILDSEARKTEFSISLKLFPYDFNPDTLSDSIRRVLSVLGTDYVESVTLAVPVIGVPVIGIGRDSNHYDSDRYTKDLLQLWKVLERFVDTKVIKTLGLVDVETDVFIYLYERANVKPKSIQVNLQSCCVVPAELRSFAKEHDVTILTHKDPPVIWDPKDDPEYRHLKLEWIARYLVHIKDRGVLHDKRYVIKLNENQNE